MTTHDLRIALRLRRTLSLDQPLFAGTDGINGLQREADRFAYLYNTYVKDHHRTSFLSPADLNATAILHLLYQTLLDRYLRDLDGAFFDRMLPRLSPEARYALGFYAKEFPSPLLDAAHPSPEETEKESLRGFFIHRVMQTNPAMIKAASPLIAPEGLAWPYQTEALTRLLSLASGDGGPVAVHGANLDLFSFLTEPARRHPDSLSAQIDYILATWRAWLPEDLRVLLLKAQSYMKEEHRPRFAGTGGTPEMKVPDYSALENDYEAFTPDQNWMPNVVMMAKSTLVWLDQLTKKYGRPITTLDQIPDAELDTLRHEGFTALWLIGLWERSKASKTIKNLCGNPDAEASAYSLEDYEISPAIGGWKAVDDLRRRCRERGIRLASDMVPNHTGIDSRWVMEHPEYFLQQDYPPFPSYTYDGPDLSPDAPVEIKIEDHYYNRTDAAVTFRRRDKRTGATTYIFHGNDGTSMPWNDTAQLDFLNPATREAVYQEIRHVAQNFPIIRFDAAMTLAKRHIRRLWYPQLGAGGDIAGRANAAMSDEEFNARIPKEFWREVVDRIEKELPDTLLLAEAFWMMEGYFVRTLGMHRVYNSAFMNMLKNQENQKYRESIKKTLAFEPEILKRYVNFMNNPDEETARAQFGDGDKYFGVCTLLATMPGLPMFGHGQLEGFREKYGMEYKRAYWDEQPDARLLAEHERRIFPLLRTRWLYSGVDHFWLFDLVRDGEVQESAYCYTNGVEGRTSLIAYNNQYEAVDGTIFRSCPKLAPAGAERTLQTATLAQALGLTGGDDRFMVYTRFPEGLTYLTRSRDVRASGWHFHLNGYETVVFTDIREVADTDGTYARLYALLDGRGTKSLGEALLALKLEPVHRLLAPLGDTSFLQQIHELTEGSHPMVASRKVALTALEAYQALQKALPSLPEATKKALPALPQAIDTQKLLDQISGIGSLFAPKEDHGLWRHAGVLMRELDVEIAIAVALLPFLSQAGTATDALRVCDGLLTHRLFSRPLESLGLGDAELRHICHGGALLAVVGSPAPGKTAQATLRAMLEDPAVRTWTGCNSWQGTTYYRKEAMQDFFILASLSLAMHGHAPGTFVRDLLKAEEGAAYRLERLLG